MRPVFSDLLTEIQRSIGYFHQHRQGGQDRRRGGVGQRHEAARACSVTSRRTLEYEVEPIAEFKNLSAGSTAGKAAVPAQHPQLCRGVWPVFARHGQVGTSH